MLRLLSLASALLALSALGSANTIIVNQVNVSWSPANVTINLGDTVRWVRNSGTHDVCEGTDGTVDGDEAFYQLLDGINSTFEVTFDATFLAAHPRPGNKYDYFCSPHFFLGMVGTVTVAGAPGTTYCACPAVSAPCGNAGTDGEGCANSTGHGAVLGGSGTSSVVADDLVMHAAQMPTNQPALLFAALNQVNGGAGNPFGDGLRCAGGSVVRLGVRIADASGSATWGPGLGATGGWSFGDTRRFQTWYRDPSGTPCGNAFNLSNGYEVLFN
ncbi:MAG: hypothetical protein H6828_07265 [Planctomycetes bacterium]|nr:hypothetical protein [Planctomycetota bacterium]